MKSTFNSRNLFYHATTSNHLLSIYKQIDVNCGNETVDFGRGFYLTSNITQAEIWAKRKMDLHNSKENKKAEKSLDYSIQRVCGIIISFQVNFDELTKLKGILFEEPDDRWSTFVYNNRTERNLEPTENNNSNQQFDYVYGPLADGKTMDLVLLVDNAELSIEEFSKYIIPKDKLEDQLSLHSEKAINCLKIKEVKKHDFTIRQRPRSKKVF